MGAREVIYARAPSHLGDGVMALPALAALSRIGPLIIGAPRWGPDLYRDVPATVIAADARAQADVAVLFKPSLGAALAVRHIPRRLGVPSDGRRLLLTDVVEEGAHQADTYVALVARLGAKAVGAPVYEGHADDPTVAVPKGHVGLNPISKAGSVREWQGYAELAMSSPDPVVFYGGPGEHDRVAAHAGDFPMRVGLSLPAFASALQQCAVFITNDSGAAHFARAVGAPVVVIHGSTTGARSGAAGSRPVEGPDMPCRPCYGSSCEVGLGCLAIPVSAVAAAARLERALR